MPPSFDSLALIAEKRHDYERHLLSLVACGRALAECGCWHHDTERLHAVASLGDYIRKTALACAETLVDLQALEARLLRA